MLFIKVIIWKKKKQEGSNSQEKENTKENVSATIIKKNSNNSLLQSYWNAIGLNASKAIKMWNFKENNLQH